MPKATAVWLIENTSLTFMQIAEFCGLHILEIQALADGDADCVVVGLDPILSGQLDEEDIKICEQDATCKLKIKICEKNIKDKKKSKYTPLSKRQEKPDAIAWVVKHYPNISDSDICHLLGTTKQTVGAVRTKTHWNSSNLKPKNPIMLGLCSQKELDELLQKLSDSITS